MVSPPRLAYFRARVSMPVLHVFEQMFKKYVPPTLIDVADAAHAMKSNGLHWSACGGSQQLQHTNGIYVPDVYTIENTSESKRSLFCVLFVNSFDRTGCYQVQASASS